MELVKNRKMDDPGVGKSIRLNATLNTVIQLCQLLFPLITIPYVTRVLGPDNYGKINFGNSIISYFSLFAALGFRAFGIREGAACRGDSEKLSNFVSTIFSMNVVTMLLSYAVLGIILLTGTFSDYCSLLIIQSISIFLTTIGTDWLNTVFEEYRYITIRYLFFQAMSLVLMFLFVKKPDDYIIYASIVVLSSAGANVLNFIHVRRFVRIRFHFEQEWKDYLKATLIFFANSIAITIYVNSDITMLGILADDYAVGVYTLSSKIYTIVKQLLNAVVVVTLPKLSYMARNGDRKQYDRFTNRILETLSTLVIPAAIGMIFLCSDVIQVIGGERYIAGTSSLRILSVGIIFSLLATFFTSCVLSPLKLEKYILLATSFSAVTNIILNFMFIPLLGHRGAAITTLISEIIVCVIGYFCSRKLWRFHIGISQIIKILLGCIPIVLICLFVTLNCRMSSVMNIVVCVGISVPLYFCVQLLLKNEIVVEETRKIIAKFRR